MDLSILSQNEGKSPPSRIPLILCPNCEKSIPLLHLYTSKGQMNICLTCSCATEQTKKSLKQFIDELAEIRPEVKQCSMHPATRGKQCCTECSKKRCMECIRYHNEFAPKHILTENELQCGLHKKPISVYCEGCKLNQCEKCRCIHQDNEKITIQHQPVEPQLKLIDAIMKENKESTDKFLQRIEKEIGRLSQMKTEIQVAYSMNEETCEEIRKLLLSISQTSLAFKSYPSYELMRLQQAINLNSAVYKGGELIIDEEFKALNYYLKISHLFKHNKGTNKCTETLIGHNDFVTSLVELKDGRLASASHDNSIRLWKKDRKKSTATLTGHCLPIRCLIELQNGQLASGSNDTTIRLWNSATSRCTTTLTGHQNEVECLIELNDGRLASGSFDMTIRLWNATTRECTTTLTGHENLVYCLAELKDGCLASGSCDWSIRIWNTATKECKAKLIGHRGTVQCLIQLSDGQLASGGYDGLIKLWSPTTYRLNTTLPGHRDYVWCLHQLEDGRLASGSSDCSIKLWDLTTKQCKATLKEHNAWVACLVEMEDGRLASCSGDKTIRLWDV